MRIAHYVTACILTATTTLSAGWNEDFDEQTRMLVQEIPALQNPQYDQDYEFFKGVREVLTRDGALISQLQNWNPELKLMVQNKGLNVIIKKRRNNHIHDAFIWELSYLLGSNRYVLPSFPMEIGGIRVIVQRLEPFEFGNMEGGGYSKGTLDKISLKTYWLAHIQAYLLGLSDLACANIGVDSKGIIRFFDNEASLIYYNVPFKNELCFSTGFICQSLDWPQYKTPLDSSTAKKLRTMVANLSNIEETLKIYLSHRDVFISEEGLGHRLEVLRNFNFQKGATFRDFYAAVFPRLASGLDEVNLFANSIMKRKVGHGTTLFFTCRRLKDYKLTPEQQSVLNQWVKTYIE